MKNPTWQINRNQKPKDQETKTPETARHYASRARVNKRLDDQAEARRMREALGEVWE